MPFIFSVGSLPLLPLVFWPTFFYIVLFSTNLYKYRVILSAVPGTVNIHVPSRIVFCERESWRSLSQMIHVRGSSQQAFVSSMVDIGSLMAMSAAILRLFDIYDQKEGQQRSQIIGCYFLMSAGMGGVIMNFVRLEVSVSFSKLVNLLSRCIHLFGALLYSLFGSLAFVIYNKADWMSLLLLFLFTLGFITWQICRRFLPLESDDSGRVHYISRVNIVTEVIAVTVSAFAMVVLCYEMGNDSCDSHDL